LSFHCDINLARNGALVLVLLLLLLVVHLPMRNDGQETTRSMNFNISRKRRRM
jgi:hypothetical protein